MSRGVFRIRGEHLRRVDLFYHAKSLDLENADTLFGFNDQPVEPKKRKKLREILEKIEAKDNTLLVEIVNKRDYFCGECDLAANCAKIDTEEQDDAVLRVYGVETGVYSPREFFALLQGSHRSAYNNLCSLSSSQSMLVPAIRHGSIIIEGGRLHRLDLYLCGRLVGLSDRSLDILLNPNFHTIAHLKRQFDAIIGGMKSPIKDIISFTNKGSQQSGSPEYNTTIAQLFGVEIGRSYTVRELYERLLEYHQRGAQLGN